MEEGVRDLSRKSNIASEPFIFNGVSTDDFRKADIPSGRELSLKEKVEYMRRKKIAKVAVSIKIVGLEDSTTNIYDEFNLQLDSKKHVDNLIVIQKHLDETKNLADQLLIKWESEI